MEEEYPQDKNLENEKEESPHVISPEVRQGYSWLKNVRRHRVSTIPHAPASLEVKLIYRGLFKNARKSSSFEEGIYRQYRI